MFPLCYHLKWNLLNQHIDINLFITTGPAISQYHSQNMKLVATNKIQIFVIRVRKGRSGIIGLNTWYNFVLWYKKTNTSP